MQLYLPDAKVYCPCIAEDDPRSYHIVSSLKICPNCHVRRCTSCLLHSPKEKNCNRCNREYTLDETHCHRCYTCPLCDDDLKTYPLSYKSSNKDNGHPFELVKRDYDKSKIVGKSVLFRCKCGYKFNTKIETKPQSLQEIVTSNIKDDVDERFSQLKEYLDWCMNYHRILDKQARGRWKNEILEKFSSFEAAKILSSASSHSQLIEREKEMIIVDDDTVDENKLRPTPCPRRLSVSVSYICPTCLDDVTDSLLSETLPLVHAVPMVGYPSKKVREIEGDCSTVVPILISFINGGDKKMLISLMEGSDEKFEIGPRHGEVSGLSNVPTCLLSHVSAQEGSWKKELTRRDSVVLSNIKYKEGVEVESGLHVDSGSNWITIVLAIDIASSEKTSAGKIDFSVHTMIHQIDSDEDANTGRGESDATRIVEYRCRALI